MKKQLLLVTLGLALVSCGGISSISSSTSSNTSSNETTSSNSSINILEKLQSKLDALSSNNFTTVYSTGTSTTYVTYRNQNYYFDTYNEKGYIALEDNSVYEFSVYDNVAMLKMPLIGTYDEIFTENFETISVDLAKDGDESNEGLYKIDDLAIVSAFAHTVNMSIYYNGEVYLNQVAITLDQNDDISFALYNINNTLSLSGTIKNVNNTSFKPAEEYLAKKIYPENERLNDKSLIEIFGDGSFSARVEGKDYLNKSQFSIIVDEQYYYNVTDENNGSGYILLSDNLAHEFEIKNGELNVQYDYIVDKDEFNSQFTLSRVDYSKFTETNDNIYVTRDYFNVNNLAYYLGFSQNRANALMIIVDDDNVILSFYNGADLVGEATLTDINNVSIKAIDDYLKLEQLPSVPSHENTLPLVEAIGKINNYQIIGPENTLLGNVIVSDNGRIETWEINGLDRDRNFAKLSNRYYKLIQNGDTFTPDLTTSYSLEEYQKLYDIHSLDYSMFYYLGDDDGRFYSSSIYAIDLFTNILSISGNNTVSGIYISIDEDNNLLNIDVVDSSIMGGGESERYILQNINSTDTSIIDNVIQNFDESQLDKGDHQDLKSFFAELKEKENFRIHFYSTDEDEYTSADDDFYTKDGYYSGYFNDGIVKTENGYFYEYANNYEDPNTEVIYPQIIGSHPLNYNSVFELSKLDYFTDSVIDNFVKQDNGTYISNNENDIISMASTAYMSPGFCYRLELKLIEDGLHVTFYTKTYETDENNVATSSFEYEIYVEFEIVDVGSTIIPNSANMPSLR